MQIKQVDFIKSSTSYTTCPPAGKPEYAFIGRSNVGKSSLLNMLCGRRKIAKTSSTPGKTRLINHFEVNRQWYMVDLPGYGYAKLPKTERAKFTSMINGYIFNRPNLVNLFVLIDARHEAREIDLSFMQKLGLKQVPFSVVFTKTDKLKPADLKQNLERYQSELLKEWQELPPLFVTSATKAVGREEILQYIESLNHQVK